MSKKSRARLTGFTWRFVPVDKLPFNTPAHRDCIPFPHDFDAAPLPKRWGDHPQTFIGPVRDGKQECVEFRFDGQTKKDLHEALARLGGAGEAARTAFIGDLEWALLLYITFELVDERAKRERDKDQSPVKKVRKHLGAALVAMHEVISPERRAPSVDPNLNPEIVNGLVKRLDLASKNRGGRPREWPRRRFIQQAAESYKTHFGEWPPESRGSSFLNVLSIALTAVGSPEVDLHKEVCEVVRELKGSSATS